MVGGTIFHRRVIQVRFPESWSSTSLARKRCSKHRQEIFVLDNAFALIEGQPFYTLAAWKAVPEVNGSNPVIVKQAVAQKTTQS